MAQKEYNDSDYPALDLETLQVQVRENKTVKIERPRLCADCRQQTQWQEVSHEFERGGLRVRISGIPAMVCSNCAAVSYPAGVPDKILAAADSLFELMLDRHRGALRAEPVPS